MENQYIDTKAFVFLFSGRKLPVEMAGPRITATGKGDGLIMTYFKDVYTGTPLIRRFLLGRISN